MNFLLDNNLPPPWAASIAACSAGKFDPGHVQECIHLQKKFPKATADVEWLTVLGEERSWVVISGDAFKKKNGAERKVIRQYGLSVFVLQPSWSTYEYWNKYSQFIKWWPRIVEQANTVESTALLVPWKISGRFKQI